MVKPKEIKGYMHQLVQMSFAKNKWCRCSWLFRFSKNNLRIIFLRMPHLVLFLQENIVTSHVAPNMSRDFWAPNYF
jgi:hypothetical protein